MPNNGALMPNKEVNIPFITVRLPEKEVQKQSNEARRIYNGLWMPSIPKKRKYRFDLSAGITPDRNHMQGLKTNTKKNPDVIQDMG
jgi:hypothetical protein